jgi:Clp amino terminal domain, pathogenicity island component
MLVSVFERFTERARVVVVVAQEEARQLMHDYIGTEHLLLALLRDEEGVAAQALASLGITVDDARRHVVRIVGNGEQSSPDAIPFTPRAKKVLELALREALSLSHNYIGTEHILLGLVREDESVAARILVDFDAGPERVRNAVMRLLPGSGAGPRTEVIQSGSEPAIDPGWLDDLPGLLAPLGAEIRSQLGRAPDVGDLLLACACVPHTPAHQGLAELGVDIDQLWEVIEHARAHDAADRRAFAERMRDMAQAKDLAMKERRLTDAARLRDQERELRERARAHAPARLAALDEIRRHLGLPTPSEP